MLNGKERPRSLGLANLERYIYQEIPVLDNIEGIAMHRID
jgi:hypothetical protein